MLNGWYICTSPNRGWMEKGKLYYFKDGITRYDNGSMSERGHTLMTFNRIHSTQISPIVTNCK